MHDKHFRSAPVNYTSAYPCSPSMRVAQCEILPSPGLLSSICQHVVNSVTHDGPALMKTMDGMDGPSKRL